MEPIKVLVDQEILVRLEDKIDRLLSGKGKEDDEVLNAQQVADLLQMDKQTIYKLARDNKIPSVKYGRSRFFSKKAIMEKLKGEKKE